MTTFNPYVITNVQDGFSVQSQGYWQGDLQDDPAVRFALSAGVVASTQATPIWGGVAVYESTAGSSSYDAVQGGAAPTIASAYNDGAGHQYLSGFTVFNGSYSVPTTPQSPVPTAVAGNSFNFVRKGTNNRIVVKCSAGIIALAGSANPQAFSWDFTNNQLIPGDGLDEFTATLIQVDTNGAVVVYDPVTGYATWNTSANVAVIQI